MEAVEEEVEVEVEVEEEEMQKQEVEKEVIEERLIPRVKTLYRHQGQGMGFEKGGLLAGQPPPGLELATHH